ncbi:MAG: L-threonylcarbamoyladenylate synthase [Eubacteriales bacterium]|nr:L-threonylcarbamoyladenylate synthase [Eubacteriales bacterium]
MGQMDKPLEDIEKLGVPSETLKHVDTKLLTSSDEDVRIAADIIANGGLVGFPTETVYGLGADALNAESVRRIYLVKGRPADNPSIVHVSDPDMFRKYAGHVTEDMEKLMDAFWPGPLTMIVDRIPEIPDVTTGGLDTVGIRMPSNETARALIRESGCAIAAPSANLSGKPSPTTAMHVMDDLAGRIEAVIDGGPCEFGIESTVIDMTGETPMILRPGMITKADFERVLGKEVLLDPTLNKRPDAEEAKNLVPKAPGQKYKHYAPNAPMIIFEGEPEAVRAAMDKEREEREASGERVVELLFEESEPEAAAHEIFAKLREADKENADLIIASALPETGVGFSVMNRMLKSAGFNIRKV